MRGDGRVPSFRLSAAIPRVISILACIKLTTTSEYGIPIEIKLWDTGRTPLAHMVDVTNEFGLKVLAEHNFLNENNIAFSPYGLMGIMVALYEGVDGESSYQIQRAMQLPWNRNVMRIGFRDIHRTLKTYFVPEEGFLAGLALNNENVTFNRQYKKILRFYGFDLENDQLPTLSPDNSTSNGTTSGGSTMSTVGAGDTTTMTMPMTAKEGTTTASTKEETTTPVATTNPNVETLTPVDMSTSTIASPSLAPNAVETSVRSTITEQATSERISETTTTMPSSPEIEMTTVVSTATNVVPTTNMGTTITGAPTTNTDTPTTPTVSPTTATVAQTTTTLIPMTTTNIPTTTSTPTTQNEAETLSDTSQMTSALTGEPSTNNELGTSTTDENTVQTSTQEMTTEASSTTLENSTPSSGMQTESVMTTSQLSTSSIDETTLQNTVTQMANDSGLETLERRKKSIVDFIFTNPPYLDDYLFYRSFDIGAELPPNTDKLFLANGLKSVQVTYMRYDTVLEYAYLPHLEASALRLPLDSDRYYLLVVLPTRGGAPELGRLLGRMARESDLSDVYSVLRPRRVKGIVPSFIVKGHVTLTTDLQKLGVRDVFEPRQRDFTPMTQQAGVYVRSIEQAVSVAIRKYQPDDHKKNRYVTIREPVVFSATYPFLYFVMDANIHVALMAGKMVDPLNSRIL